jgi:hypothetical protein
MMLQRLALLLVLILAPSMASAELTLFWRAESTTLDEAGNNDYALGDNSASLVGSGALNTTAVKYGTNGIHINASSEYYQFDLAENFVGLNGGAVAFWIQWVTFSTTGNTWFEARGNTSTNYYRGRGFTGDILRLLSSNATPSSSNYDTTGTSITTSAWYFVCYAWSDSANTRKIYIWDNAGAAVGSSPFIDTTTNYNGPAELTGASARLRFGESSGTGGTVEYYLDNIFAGNSPEDCIPFYDNRDITAYSSYSAGGAAETFGSRLRLHP